MSERADNLRSAGNLCNEAVTEANESRGHIQRATDKIIEALGELAALRGEVSGLAASSPVLGKVTLGATYVDAALQGMASGILRARAETLKERIEAAGTTVVNNGEDNVAEAVKLLLKVKDEILVNADGAYEEAANQLGECAGEAGEIAG